MLKKHQIENMFVIFFSVSVGFSPLKFPLIQLEGLTLKFPSSLRAAVLSIKGQFLSSAPSSLPGLWRSAQVELQNRTNVWDQETKAGQEIV